MTEKRENKEHRFTQVELKGNSITHRVHMNSLFTPEEQICLIMTLSWVTQNAERVFKDETAGKRECETMDAIVGKLLAALPDGIKSHIKDVLLRKLGLNVILEDTLDDQAAQILRNAGVKT